MQNPFQKLLKFLFRLENRSFPDEKLNFQSSPPKKIVFFQGILKTQLHCCPSGMKFDKFPLPPKTFFFVGCHYRYLRLLHFMENNFGKDFMFLQQTCKKIFLCKICIFHLTMNNKSIETFELIQHLSTFKQDLMTVIRLY